MAKKQTGTQQSYRPDDERFRRARNRLGMSVPAFAAKCGVSKGTIQNIENGEKITGSILTTIFDKVATTELAKELGCEHWHDLLHEDERKELGSALSAPTPQPLPLPSLTNRLFQLPAALTDFVGRKEQFDKIVARLSGDGGKVGLSAIRGMGGVGKTCLAVLVAHEVKDKFPDAQLFLELRGVSETPVTAIEAMSRIILDFHPETGKLPDTEAELLPLYRSVLHGKRALIVLDNAKDESQVKPLLSAGPPAAFLITSRNALMLDGVEGVRLDVLPPDDAFKMLREIVGAKGTNADLRTVAELCGWLPLALRVAGDFLRLHENWTVPRYTEALRDEAKRLERLKGKTADRDVEAVLALSAIELVRENPERAERWQVLSVFPADFNAKAAAAVWELDENATLDELTAFLDRNLLQHDVDTNRYDLHDLMRPVARDTFEYVDNHPLQASVEVRVRTAERHFAQHYSEVLAFSNHLYLQGGDKFQLALTLFDRESPNIRYAQAWAVRRFDENLEDRFAAELCVRFALTSPFTGDLRLTSLEKIRWLESAVAGSRTIGNKHWEGMALGNLGCVHANLGDARTAISFHKQNLAVAREIKDSRSEGNALGNLGNAHLYLGDANTAITFHQQNLTVTREIGDRRGEGNALGNLGIAYAALGDTHTAITFYEQSLVVSREIGDRRHVGTTFGNLGNAHVALGDANTAISFHEQFLEIAREIGDRRGEGTSLGNLGNAYAELGDARRAVTFYDQQLTITRDIGDRRGEGNASWNMAVALDLLGQHDDAVRHAANALAIREAIEDPNTEKVRRKLAEWRGEE